MDFDEVFDTQKAFRTMMDAFSRPLEPFALPDVNGGFDALKRLAVFTLVDSAVSLSVQFTGSLAGELFELTRAKRAGLEDADFIVANADADPEYLGRARQGSLVDPQRGATVIVFAQSLAGRVQAAASLSRTGQANTLKSVSLAEDLARTLHKASALAPEYPMGFDMLFVDSTGMAMAAPRRVRLAEGL